MDIVEDYQLRKARLSQLNIHLGSPGSPSGHTPDGHSGSKRNTQSLGYFAVCILLILTPVILFLRLFMEG
jgi:hypothetical protein